jgi:predicted lipoprotein with Yx(FWY)xxD motif
MKVITLTPLAVALTVALAACGGGSSSSSSSTPSASQLSVKQVDGVGSVLMDAQGRAVYTPREEAGGRLLCTKGCTAIWKPVPAVSGGAPDGVGKLGTVQRPDGTAQLTVAGRPAYTFTQDAPGKVNGDGVTDAFAGHRFSWQAVKAAGSSSSSTQPSRGAYGY